MTDWLGWPTRNGAAMTFLFDIENEQNQHLEGAPRLIHIFQADAPL